MSFFKNIFSHYSESLELPKIQFGRYSDSYKKEIKYDAWDQALQKFIDEEYIQAYRLFFNYLRDDEHDNVTISEDKGIISFSFVQGSKIITGTADSTKVYAEAKIAKLHQPNIGIFRQLLEENYQLKYSRYTIDDNQNVTIVFSTSSLDGSPYKLYYALKELAVVADNTDDILVSKYSELEAINFSHIRKVSEHEKSIKYKFLKDKIESLEMVLKNTKLDVNKHPGGLSYLYLDVVYKLDFLIKPEGYCMDAFAKINSLYFKDKIMSVEQKNSKIYQVLKELSNYPANKFYNELYEVKSTFGVTTPSGHGPISNFILDEVENMNWYLKSGHYSFALAIPSYIVGCSLYQYSLPAPMRELFLLFYKIVEHTFFKNLGFDCKYVSEAGVLDDENIRKAIKNIVKSHEEDYNLLKFHKKKLVYSDVYSFAKSFLIMIAKMNFSRKDMR